MPHTDALIIDAVRTPVGRYGGALRGVRPDDLLAHVLQVLCDRTQVPPEEIEDVVAGCANQAGEDNRNVARMAALLAGLPVSVAGVTINRLCGSGLEAARVAAHAIMAGEGELFLAGGVESMTRAPAAVMGLGPVPATMKARARAGLTMDQMDLVELNEAFAAQALPCIRDLGIRYDRLNVNRGAIALGHPLGMSGARLACTLVHELERRGGRYGLATMCIGVGQGIALIVEAQP
jgi:acetyl-CoA acetyltransferase